MFSTGRKDWLRGLSGLFGKELVEEGIRLTVTETKVVGVRKFEAADEHRPAVLTGVETLS